MTSFVYRIAVHKSTLMTMYIYLQVFLEELTYKHWAQIDYIKYKIERTKPWR